MEALVRAVRPGVRILDAGDEDAGGREGIQELRDERDGAADAHVDGRGAVPGLGEGGPSRVVRRAGRVDLGGLARVDLGDGELGTPRDVFLEVTGERVARVG